MRILVTWTPFHIDGQQSVAYDVSGSPEAMRPPPTHFNQGKTDYMRGPICPLPTIVGPELALYYQNVKETVITLYNIACTSLTGTPSANIFLRIMNSFFCSIPFIPASPYHKLRWYAWIYKFSYTFFTNINSEYC